MLFGQLPARLCVHAATVMLHSSRMWCTGLIGVHAVFLIYIDFLPHPQHLWKRMSVGISGHLAHILVVTCHPDSSQLISVYLQPQR